MCATDPVAEAFRRYCNLRLRASTSAVFVTGHPHLTSLEALQKQTYSRLHTPISPHTSKNFSPELQPRLSPINMSTSARRRLMRDFKVSRYPSTEHRRRGYRGAHEGLNDPLLTPLSAHANRSSSRCICLTCGRQRHDMVSHTTPPTLHIRQNDSDFI